jgi:hypothetical protein
VSFSIVGRCAARHPYLQIDTPPVIQVLQSNQDADFNGANGASQIFCGMREVCGKMRTVPARRSSGPDWLTP